MSDSLDSYLNEELLTGTDLVVQCSFAADLVLTPLNRVGLDPHRVHAPYATVHSGRHILSA